MASVALAYLDRPDGEMWSLGLPWDQGVRDKLPIRQLDLFEMADPNLTAEDWQYFLRWLLLQRIVYHNAKYDQAMMRAGTRHWAGVDLAERFLWDTMVAQKELTPVGELSLESLSRKVGMDGKKGVAELKGWLKREKFPASRYDLVPWNIVKDYVTTDAEITAAAYLWQLAQFEAGEGDRARLEREFQLLQVLHHMEHRGIGYDAATSLEAAEELERRAAAIEARLPFKCDPSGAKAYFVEKLGLQTDRVSEKTGTPTIDEEQVRKWITEGVPGAQEFALVTKARRAVSMWYQGWAEKVGPDGRLRTSYKQTKVKSGRMSVERVQLQAMPKKDKYSAVGSNERLEIYEGLPDVRDLMVARPGYGIWNIDLSQAELRVATKYSGCRKMAEMLAAGMDIHSETCKQVLHKTEDDPDWKTARDVAKRLTFGGIFQIGGETFQSTLSKLANIYLPLHECEQYVRNWRGMYPEFGVAYRKAEQMFVSKGYVRVLPNTEYEMRSYMGPRDWPRTGWNRIVQGSLAEFMKLWMIDTEHKWPGHLLLTVHDSLVLEAPVDEGDELAAAVAARGAEMATELFKTTMIADLEVYTLNPLSETVAA